jgi:Zn-finger nucleic acid-binding protein
MTDVAPFQERPKFLLCPRCGEMLEHAFDAVLACLRCEGLWLAAVTLEQAFGDPRWPRDRTLWWRNALECPECASEGETKAMAAVYAGGVVVDRCASHGLWLDRTELLRIMGGGDDPGEAGVSSDLFALRSQLEVPEADLEQLARRRDAWQNDRGLRRKAAQEYRVWLEAEQRRRLESAAAATQAEREQAEVQQAEVQQAEVQHEQDRAIQRLDDSREEASAEVGRLETQIIMLRERLRAAEAELDGARGRLRAVDDQLEAIRPHPG